MNEIFLTLCFYFYFLLPSSTRFLAGLVSLFLQNTFLCIWSPVLGLLLVVSQYKAGSALCRWARLSNSRLGCRVTGWWRDRWPPRNWGKIAMMTIWYGEFQFFCHFSALQFKPTLFNSWSWHVQEIFGFPQDSLVAFHLDKQLDYVSTHWLISNHESISIFHRYIIYYMLVTSLSFSSLLYVFKLVSPFNILWSPEGKQKNMSVHFTILMASLFPLCFFNLMEIF